MRAGRQQLSPRQRCHDSQSSETPAWEPGPLAWVRGFSGLLIPYQEWGYLEATRKLCVVPPMGSSGAADCVYLATGVSNAQHETVAPRNAAFLSSDVQHAGCKTLPCSH